jgi:hypothetical protein
MYKPNGEERMTRQEEMQRRKALSMRKIAAARVEPTGKNLCSAIRGSLFYSPAAREEFPETMLQNLR